MKLPALMLLILPLASCAPARHSPSSAESAYDLPAFERELDSLRTTARIPGLSAAVVKDGEVIFAQGLRCEPPQQTLRHLLTHTAIGQPGTQFSYNPILYSWASRPMMEVAGKPFSQLVEQYAFQPAGMARSARTNRDLPLREDLAAAIAIPYHVDSAGMMVRSPERAAQGDGAAGGVISTVLGIPEAPPSARMKRSCADLLS